ncbi:MAG: hypothetical protein JJU00_14500 [Opitutales bacterium]|nr:hypothetical protein [Opitutales bacterium]
MRDAIADTGALVALLDRSDEHHKWAVECFKTLRAPVTTCEAVLAESWHLLGWALPARATLAKLYLRGVLSVHFDFGQQAGAIWRLLEK